MTFTFSSEQKSKLFLTEENDKVVASLLHSNVQLLYSRFKALLFLSPLVWYGMKGGGGREGEIMRTKEEI